MCDVDLDHAGPAREDERLRELLLADRAEHRLDRAAAVRVEGTAEVADDDSREAAQHAVDHPRRDGPAERILAREAPAACDVVAGLDRLDETRDVLRLVLQVSVHRHDDVAACAGEAGVHGWVLAEVALEAHGAYPRIGGVEALERRERAVGRAIVDEDQLEGPRPRLERGDAAAVELLDRPGLVVDGDDDRDVRGRQFELGWSAFLAEMR